LLLPTIFESHTRMQQTRGSHSKHTPKFWEWQNALKHGSDF
jgi:hypothetical protein